MKYKIILKNYISSFGLLLLSIILNFIYVREIIAQYGSVVNGYIAAVMGIFAYLDIIEGGVGAATEYSLFRPLSKKNYNKANEVLAFTNYYFKKMGIAIIIISFFVGLIYPGLIEQIDFIFGFIIILITGMTTSINYFSSSKYYMLVNADRKLYVIKNIVFISTLISYIFVFALISFKIQFIVVYGAFISRQFIYNIILHIYVKKKYPWLDTDTKKDKQLKTMTKDVFVQKISTLAFFSTDIILISVFVSIKMASVYAVYNMIINGLSKLMNIIVTSPQTIFGHLSVDENKVYLWEKYGVYEYMTIIAIFIFSASYIVLINPFIIIYTNGISQDTYLYPLLGFLLIIYFIIRFVRSNAAKLVNTNGLFKEVKIIYFREALINLLLSLSLVLVVGIYGVVIASITAISYSTVVIIKMAYKDVLDHSVTIFYKRCIVNLVGGVVTSVLMMCISVKIGSLFDFFIYAGIVFCISCIIQSIINYILNKDDFLLLVTSIKSIVLKSKNNIRIDKI